MKGTLHRINDILSEFNPVSLTQTEKVRLMNRIDRKYWFHISDLCNILEKAVLFYDILEINGQRLMEYQTTYFDTPDNLMYRFHHNRKLNRFKIRKRRYFSTNIHFLEVKLKNNKKRTVKERVEIIAMHPEFSDEEIAFIKDNTPYECGRLKSKLKNRFQRITLVNKNGGDRCTIDLNLEFQNTSGEVKLNNLVIIEIKRSRCVNSSPMAGILKEMKIKHRGLSKYCTGRAILEPELKQNEFKPRLRYLKKEILFNS